MPITATFVAHGAPSFDALADAVRAAKGSEPLAPVTVIVPTNTAGVMARRALGRRGGVAAVDVLTLYRVAEVLGAPSLHDEGRNPVSTPIVDVAVKQVLATSAGLYGDVATHPTTVVALRDLYREVRLAGRGAMTALGRTVRGREPARVLADVARRLAIDWYDEGDLMERAAQQARRSLLRRFHHVVVHAPERLRPLELELLRTLGDVGDVHLLVARTGDDDADRLVLDLAAELTDHRPGVTDRATPLKPVDVISTTDADEEVRVAVRALLDAGRAGTPFDRMALLWPIDRPYARLAEHHLAKAELPWNGRPGTTVLERMVPRVLTELLDLDRRGLRRVPLLTLLGDVPARSADGKPVPTAQWERIARAAGIVRESHWDTNLPRWIDEARATAEADPERRWLGDEAEAGVALAGFVGTLRAALGDPRRPNTWSGWSAWATDRVEEWFGPALGRLADAERHAWEHTQRVLDRLRHLDAISPPVTRSEFRATFVAELEAVPARRGTIGDGIHVGSLTGARGLDLDVAVIVGAADGLLPPPPIIDPLLSDDDRARSGLATSDERARNAHRQFLAVVTSTPNATVVVPRGDLRATTVHHPSRWLAPFAATAHTTETTVDSHAHGLARTEFPLCDDEHLQRDLWVHVRTGGDVRTHPRIEHDDVASRSLALRDARASDRFTEFDGDLSARVVDAFQHPISPTRVERWANCPHAFFVQDLLRVRPIEEPGDLLTVEARERGTAIHGAIDQLQRLVLDGTIPGPGPSGWNDRHRQELTAIVEAVADDLEARGLTGRAAFWFSERTRLVAEVEHWLQRDAEEWDGRTIVLSEQGFGDDGEVTLALPDGRRIAFKGSIDRVDELRDGSLLVTDHKTGSKSRFTSLRKDPTLGGTHFQLPVYAAAARVLTARPDAPIRAQYAFFGREKFARIGVTFDDETWALASRQLADVVRGVERGVFLPKPEKPGWQPWVKCEFCDPDGLGTQERWPEWERKRHDPRLADLPVVTGLPVDAVECAGEES